MNKYTLTFKNPIIEDKYQQTCILQRRMAMFTLITMGFVVVFLMRIVQGLMQENFVHVITYIAMITYFALQYFLAKKYKSLLRGSLILLNHVFTIYFLYVEEASDTLSAHLRGANQMGSNFLIILAGEYLDAMFSLISISGIRIAIIFLKSADIEYSAIGSAFLMIAFATRYLYKYHEAIRSQYLLTLVQESWENILIQINHQTPFILLNFEEEKLKFSITQSMNCNELFTNDSEALSFLRESQCDDFSLEEVIFQKIKQFQYKRIDQFNKIIILNYQSTLIKLEYSIFFGNRPSILLIFQKEPKLSQNSRLVNKYHEFVNTFIGFFEKFQNQQQAITNKCQIQQIRRKLLLAKLIQKVYLNNFKCKKIRLSEIFQQLTSLYAEYNIHVYASSPYEIRTCPTILCFFFITVMESLLTERITILQSLNKIHKYILIGYFEPQQLLRIGYLLKYQYQLIFKKLQISPQSKEIFYLEIVFQLHPQAYIPFR